MLFSMAHSARMDPAWTADALSVSVPRATGAGMMTVEAELRSESQRSQPGAARAVGVSAEP